VRHICRLLVCCSLFGLFVSIAAAQIDPLGGLGGGDLGRSQVDPVSVTAEIKQPQSGKPPVLAITAQIAQGYHIYSLTQPKGGPLATRITLEPASGYRPLGELQSTEPPHRSVATEFNNLPIETHERSITWQVPIDPAAGTDLKTLRIVGKLNAMACDAGACLPPKDYPFTATWSASEAAATVGIHQRGANQPTIRGHIEPKVVPPGGTVRLRLTAEPAAGWHVYALAEGSSSNVSKPAVIEISQPTGWTVGKPIPSMAPKLKPVAGQAVPERVYEQPVTWTVEINAPQTAQLGEHAIAGIIGYQTCNASGCMPPSAAQFSVQATVGEGAVEGQIPLAFTPAAYPKANEVSEFDPARFNVAADAELSRTPLWLAMILGFAGGLILNLMPCVLPVIGLKILSFVEQSGHHRSQILLLNLWYSAGLISVFMLLAALAAFAGLGWGQLFSYTGFNVTLAAIVFAMGLSFLGVWEIPIPGFVGSGATGSLAQQEGVAGAFTKGVITTILATPCSGPFLASALAWAVAQPPHLTFAVFAAVGIGMASPYLLIGMFPALVRFLPRPGMWMETFKQIMGFVLLGTVVYILTFVPWEYVVPTVALLIGVWAGCWWIGRTSGTAELGEKLRAWAIAGAVVAASCVLAFSGLDEVAPGIGPTSLREVMLGRYERDIEREIAENFRQQRSRTTVSHAPHALAWQPFSRDFLEQLTRERKTVLVDFTADWCLTCKTLEAIVLNTAETRNLIEANKIVTLQADWTDGSPEITNMLDALGSKQVPVIAIFPAGRPNEPIVFRGSYTKQALYDAINSLAAPRAVKAAQQPAVRPAESVHASLLPRR
jgi:suppressor for copper-sensitivity B